MPFVMSATSPHETLLDEGPVPEPWPALNEVVEVPNSTTA